MCVGTRAERGRLTAHPLVVAVHHAREHPDRAAGGQSRRRVPGVVQHGGGGLEEEPLLGVHRLRVGRRYLEEERVELVDAVQESAPLAVTALDP